MNWTRVEMTRITQEWMSQLPRKEMDALEISGEAWSSWGFKSYTSLQYPDFDICAPPSNGRTWDIVIAEQVFEHILWPYRAVKHVYALLNRGGYFLITTPFLLPVHEVPVDCSRWTETGLKYLLAEGGFPLESIRTGSWGNMACVKANLKKWQPYSRWRHSLENSPRHPVVVWALARTPAQA